MGRAEERRFPPTHRRVNTPSSPHEDFFYKELFVRLKLVMGDLGNFS